MSDRLAFEQLRAVGMAAQEVCGVPPEAMQNRDEVSSLELHRMKVRAANEKMARLGPIPHPISTAIKNGNTDNLKEAE